MNLVCICYFLFFKQFWYVNNFVKNRDSEFRTHEIMWWAARSKFFLIYKYDDLIIESFYSVKYGFSIILSNIPQIISEKKRKTLVLQEKWYSKIVHFCILIHILSWNIYLRWIIIIIFCYSPKHFFRIAEKKIRLKINNYLTV